MIAFTELTNAIKEDHLCDYLEQNIKQTSHISLQHDFTYKDYKRSESKTKFDYYFSKIKTLKQNVEFIVDKYNVSGKIDAIVRGSEINQVYSYNFDLEDECLYPICFTDSRLEKRSHRHTLRDTSSIKILKSKLFLSALTLEVSFGLIIGRHVDKRQDIDIAIVEFDDDDAYIRGIVEDAVKWAEFMKANFATMCIDPPSHPNLYPNMCTEPHKNPTVAEQKRELALKNDEITLICNVGIKHRRHALSKGITKWSQNDLCSQTLGMNTKTKTSQLVDAILRANRAADPLVDQSKIPEFCNAYDMFVDFETSSMYEWSNYLFMIGYCMEQSSNFTGLVAKEPSLAEEQRIFKQFVDAINEKAVRRIVHYSSHEKIVCEHLKRRHGFGIPESVEWVDLRTHIENIHFIPKGALNFKLKSVVKAMHKWNMLETVWTSDCKDGEEAMFDSFVAYKVNDTRALADVLEYNRVDVVSMMEIWRYLKSICKEI
jgi:uncharacterized protein YprB with RNaseH-like and TPR domain